MKNLNVFIMSHYSSVSLYSTIYEYKLKSSVPYYIQCKLLASLPDVGMMKMFPCITKRDHAGLADVNEANFHPLISENNQI